MASARVLRRRLGRARAARCRPAGLMTETAPASPPPRNPEPEQHAWLVRHGETEWARLGRHTGHTDVPLTETGRQQARALGRRLAGATFGLVLTSPLSRAAETADLAGFAERVVDPDLREWDYGAFEGRTTVEIREDYPGWSIWTGPWPEGETVEQVGARVDRVLARIR